MEWSGNNDAKIKIEMIRFLLIFLVLFSPFLGNAQDNQPTGITKKINTTATPKNLQLTHIEIQEQFIDFGRLINADYRQELVFGEVLSQSFDSLSLLPHYGYPATMDLPHYLNDLTFHFSAVDWQTPYKIKYSYYLEGLETEWSTPNTNAFANYQNLWHGKYTLKVKTMGIAQVWSAPITYTFSIQRPWWFSWWAYVFYSGLLVVITFSIYRFMESKKADAEEIERLLKENQLLIFSNKVAKKTRSSNKEDSFLDQVHQTLEAHLSDENFGIAELCEILKISRAQLHRRLKKLTGQSTSHYIRSLRLDIAKGLLQKTNLNVSEVAFTVGFSNATYFSKVFKEEFGFSPKEFK